MLMLQKTVLLSGIDVNLIVTKSIVKMLKLFLTKPVATQYTASRLVAGKKFINKTNFYTIIEGFLKFSLYT